MISTQDRIIAVELINEAKENGARLKPACEVLDITDRTYQRWTKEGDIKQDQRPLIKRPIPKNKITEEERTEIIETVNKPEYADLVPSQIAPKLATEGKYIASESTFYRVLNGSPSESGYLSSYIRKSRGIKFIFKTKGK